jgi:peptidoglycan/xylan/chitin deacetylase (PgdA/CDA1 family)
MYFNKKNNFFHGIMFHHFHDDKIHTRSQGSISRDNLYKIIKFIGKKNIINADLFLEKFKNNKLKKNEVCLTFDDAIKSQIDIALPVLEDLKIKSFFFVYTSIFEGKPDLLEVFRYFRMNYFDTVEQFYKNFYNTLDVDLNNFFQSKKKNIDLIKKKIPYYTLEDIRFRLIRDVYLGKNDYQKIMNHMMKEKNFEPEKFYPILFFNQDDLIKIDSLGHLVGLHSHSHPTLLEKLDFDEQKKEYKKNISLISKILNKPQDKIQYMSHPCGSYNSDTLKILKDLNISLGFKQIMKFEPEKEMTKINNSPLEVAREDHSLIFKRMN